MRIQLASMPLDPAGHAGRERTLLPRLAAAEQARYATFAAPQRRVTWLAGRALLLALLERSQGHADPLRLITAESGGVAYAPDIHLNLSHSGERLLAALAPVPVGVDLERVRPRAAAGEAARLFCPTEAVTLAALEEPARLTAFYRLWTLKESACKAAGLSVWDGLRHACFDLATREAQLSPPFPSGNWGFLQAALSLDWPWALAWQGGAAEVEHRHLSAGGWEDVPLADAVSLRGSSALS